MTLETGPETSRFIRSFLHARVNLIMPISVSCDECFTDFKINEKYAGKKIKCKNCGGIMRVPDPASLPSPDEYEDNSDEDEAPAPPPIPRRTSSSGKKGTKKKSAGSSMDWLSAIDGKHVKLGVAGTMGLTLLIGLLSQSIAFKFVGMWILIGALMVVVGIAWLWILIFREHPVQAIMIVLLPFFGYMMVRRDHSRPLPGGPLKTIGYGLLVVFCGFLMGIGLGSYHRPPG